MNRTHFISFNTDYHLRDWLYKIKLTIDVPAMVASIFQMKINCQSFVRIFSKNSIIYYHKNKLSQYLIIMWLKYWAWS